MYIKVVYTINMVSLTTREKKDEPVESDVIRLETPAYLRVWDRADMGQSGYLSWANE